MAQEDEQRQDELHKANIRQLRLVPLDADPVDLKDGDIWYRSDLDTYRGRANGVTVTFTVS